MAVVRAVFLMWCQPKGMTNQNILKNGVSRCLVHRPRRIRVPSTHHTIK